MDARLTRDHARFGDSIRRWRALLGLTAETVAERAGISRNTLRDIEKGTGSTSFGSVMAVLRVLNIDDAVVDAVEPLNTDLGRLNANRMLVARVSRPRRPAAG